MKLFKTYSLIIAGIIIFLSVAAFYSNTDYLNKFKIFEPNASKYGNEDIIKFNHGFHIGKDVGAKCVDCHGAALTSDKSSDNMNPTMAICEACHDIKDKAKCNVCHYEGVYKKLTSHNKQLYFSHKEHITKEKKECTDCHKGLEQVKYAKDSPGGYPPMTTCYTCHNNEKATINCEACHQNLTSLKPKDHLSSNFLNEHKVVTDNATGGFNNNCMMCHSDNFCQACHSAPGFTGNNTTKSFFAPYYTYEGGVRRDKAELQKLSNVHNLNYVYTHGIDADHKAFECKTCHDPIEFCSACHMNGGNIVTGIAPKSHLQPNFTTFGVNTGGGLHAKLAKKDMESCEACHSVNGADPVCIKCHFDNDGVKGTNPKTHEFGFLHDEHGIWHSTQGAICYVCHTDPNARPNGIKGVGFCGYCHTN